jgi:hypothetical protein
MDASRSQWPKLYSGFISGLILFSTLRCVVVADTDSNAVRGGRIKPLVPAAQLTNTPAPQSPGSAQSPPIAPQNAGSESLGFDKLSGYKYEVPEDNGSPHASNVKDPDDQIPPTVKAFSGKQVALKGFMLPLKVESGLVTEMLLMRDQSMCCYGAVPRINEWVSVKMAGHGVKAIMDQPVTLHGTIKIGAMRENGYLVGIYQMAGDKMEVPGMAGQ